MKGTEEKLQALNGIANEAFGGLHATQGLKNRIMMAAEEPEKKRKTSFLLRRAPVLCTAMAGVLVVAAVMVLPGVNKQKDTDVTPQAETGLQAAQPESRMMRSFTVNERAYAVPVDGMLYAEMEDAEAPVLALAEENTDMATDGVEVLRRMSTMAAGTLSADLLESADAGGQVTIGNATTPSYHSVWDNNSLIAINDQYYYLLTSPSVVQESLKGDLLGEVQSMTGDVTGAFGIRSNCVKASEKVYIAAGMKSTVVLASVNGKLRAFQRVACAGNATGNGEKLADTLRGTPVRLVLSGRGVLEGNNARNAWNTLLSCASYAGSGLRESDETLLVEMDNGLTLQLFVSGKKLSACGTWSCPEFFDAFPN